MTQRIHSSVKWPRSRASETCAIVSHVQSHSGRIRATVTWFSILIFVGFAPYGVIAQDQNPPELTKTPKPGRYTASDAVDGIRRSAFIEIPDAYSTKNALPLVVILHGAGGDGWHVLEKDGWAEKAKQSSFIAVAPTGLPSPRPKSSGNFLTNPFVWNSGQLPERSPRTAIDDVAYLNRLLERLSQELNFDTQQLFVCGHSNGAAMTFRYAEAACEKLTAIAAVAGSLAIEKPLLRKKLPTLYIVGTEDPLQPLEGGPTRTPWGERTNRPISKDLERWAEADDCETTPVTVSETPIFKQVEYRSKAEGGPTLQAFFINGHGHMWPGGTGVLPKRLVGPSVRTFNATDVIWDYFQSVAKK